MTPKKILLASFVDKKTIAIAMKKICESVKISEHQIFIFEILNNFDQYILTYNIDAEFANLRFDSFWKDTISIHRKKETNTLFSINAINQIIKQKNNGVINENIKLDWEKYRNTFLLYRKNSLHILQVKKIKMPTN